VEVEPLPEFETGSSGKYSWLSSPSYDRDRKEKEKNSEGKYTYVQADSQLTSQAVLCRQKIRRMNENLKN
jgi:hypothetical protein